MGTKNDPGDFDCYHAAEDDEPMFILLARDPQAPGLVRRWANEREDQLVREYGSLTDSTNEDDRRRKEAKITEARKCADDMEAWADAPT